MASYKLAPDITRKSGSIVFGDPAERKVDRILLGTSAEAGALREAWLDISGEQVVAAFGKRGTGKSYSLGVMLEGLSAGAGETAISKLSTPRSGLVLDIMDIFWTSVYQLQPEGPSQIKKQFESMSKAGLASIPLNVTVWLPAGFERQQLDPSGIRKLTIAPSMLSLDDWGSLFEFDIFTEPRGMLLADAIHRVSVEGITASDGSVTPPKSEFGFDDLITAVDGDRSIIANYQDTTRRSLRQRLLTFANLPLFHGPGTPLTELLQAFKVSVLMLSRVPDALKQVIVAVLLRRLMRERGEVSFAQKRLDMDATLRDSESDRLNRLIQAGVPRTWVLLDEAHVLAGTGATSVATAALVKYAKEGRNYGLSLAVATQQPSALDARLLSQVETLIAHQLTSPQDASVAARAMRSPAPATIQIDGETSDVEGLMRRLSPGEAILSSGNAPSLQRSFVASIRSRISAHGGYEA
jgi:hypothetical protein